jgi:hypothetical protein
MKAFLKDKALLLPPKICIMILAALYKYQLSLLPLSGSTGL